MTAVTVSKGQNLWNIVKNNYGLTNSTDIANKVKDVASANHITNPNSIFTGQTIELAAIQPEAKPAEDNLGKKFDKWTEGCADASTGEVDEKNEPIFNSSTQPFNMARTPEYVRAVEKAKQATNEADKEAAGKEIGEIYKKNVEALASSIVDNADTDGDGMLSVEELEKKEADDLKKKLSGSEDISDVEFDEESAKEVRRFAAREFLMMNLDKPKKMTPEEAKDLRITKQEYAAFLMATDGNNPENIANGELTRDEYLDMGKIVVGKDNEAMKEFMKKERDSYKTLYGTDPREQKITQ